MEKLIKGSNEENKKQKRKFDSKIAYAVIGLIVVLLGIVAFFVKGGTEIQVKTGVAPTEVQTSLTKTVEPIYEQQEKIVKEQEELKNDISNLVESINKLSKAVEKTVSEKQTAKRYVKPKIKEEFSIPSSVIKGESIQIKQEEKPLMIHKSILQDSGFTEKSRRIIKNADIKYTGLNQSEKKRKKPTVYIPAGSIVFGKLMYGFTAPEKGVLPPVIISLEKAVNTSNNFYIPLQKCRITTKAQYNISQSLAVLGGKGSVLSCVLKNGKVLEVKTNVAVGEELKDGLVSIGLTGKEKWLTGKELATLGAITTGVGISEAYQQANTISSMSPQGNLVLSVKNSFGYGLAGGVNEAMNKFAEFWFKKFDKKYPAIQVLPKPVFVTFIQGVDLGIEEKEL